MSACYSVYMNIKFADNEKREQAIAAIKDYLEKNEDDILVDNRFLKTKAESSFDKIVGFFLGANDNGMFVGEEDENGFTEYSTGFNASYGWASVLESFFDTIAPFVDEKSEFEYWPDNSHVTLTIENGKVIRNEEEVEDEEEEEEFDDEDDDDGSSDS